MIYSWQSTLTFIIIQFSHSYWIDKKTKDSNGEGLSNYDSKSKRYKEKDWEVCLRKNLKVLHGNKIKEVRRQYQDEKIYAIPQIKNYRICMILIYNKDRPINQ